MSDLAGKEARPGAGPPAGAQSDIHSAFRVASDEHRSALAARSYDALQQLTETGPFRGNAPWKTYWKAEHPSHGPVFVKVNYGYDMPVNVAMGQKEAWLPAHFAARFEDFPRVRFPTVVDAWPLGRAFAVVFRQERMSALSLSALASDSAQAASLVEFLCRWATIPPPDWWDERYVLHDFGCHASLQPGPGQLAPFGFDLDENFGVDPGGRLVAHDFEFIQWTSRGLQSAYVTLKLLAARRRALAFLFDRGLAAEIVRDARESVDLLPVEQAIRAHRGKIARRESGRSRPQLRERWAEALLRSRRGWRRV